MIFDALTFAKSGEGLVENWDQGQGLQQSPRDLAHVNALKKTNVWSLLPYFFGYETEFCFPSKTIPKI